VVYGLIFLSIVVPGNLFAQKGAIDKAHSSVTVRVYKSGLFSAFAHDHAIQAPVASGEIDAASNSVQLSFNATEMKVLDPGVGESERKEIEDTMKSDKVLDVAKFPTISFTGTSPAPDASGRRQVTGTLQLHGASRQITVPVVFQNSKYTGSVTLKQTDFGITPVKIGGGAVRVKDEIVIEFSIVPESASNR